MKRFIVESKNDELTANHIIDTLENEFDIVATVKEINPIDEAKLDRLADDYNWILKERGTMDYPDEFVKDLYKEAFEDAQELLWNKKI